MPSRLPLLSCHVRQLVVWSVSADHAAGVHGSRAYSPPPVAHSPSPIYVPVFLLLVVKRLFCPCSCFMLHLLFLTSPSVPLCGRTRSTEIQQLVWSTDSAGRLWNLHFLAVTTYCLYYFVFCRENKVSPSSTLHLSPSSPIPRQNLLTRSWIQQRRRS